MNAATVPGKSQEPRLYVAHEPGVPCGLPKLANVMFVMILLALGQTRKICVNRERQVGQGESRDK